MNFLRVTSLALLIILIGVDHAEARRRSSRAKKIKAPISLVATSDEPTYGPEFTFWIDGLDNVNIDDQVYGDEYMALEIYINKLLKHLVENQPANEVFLFANGTFSSPHGWYFEPIFDPGVLEIRAKPMTVEQYTKYSRDMQDAIFVSAANIGLFPALYGGGGHINIGFQYFAQRPLQLRNFIVDYFNHIELSLGAFGYDTNNALPVAYVEKQSIKRAISALDDYIMLSSPGRNSVDELTAYLKNAIESSTDAFVGYWSLGKERGKNFALNFRNINPHEDGRIEIRAVRPQASMDVFVRQIRLLNNRIRYLSKIKDPIKYKPAFHVAVPRVTTDVTAAKALNPNINVQEALKSFYDYVTESGEKWSDHTDYLWPKWHSDGEIKKFEESEWFKEHEKKLNCVGLLAS